MKRQELPVQAPCYENWTGMEDHGERRFCGACDQEVHDLTMLTRAQAEDVLGAEHVCVRYAFDTETDEILFRDEDSPWWRLYQQTEGVGRMLAAAALAVPMLMLPACEQPATSVEEAAVVAPIVIEAGEPPRVEASSHEEVGAGRRPTLRPSVAPKVDPEVEPEVECHEGVDEPVGEKPEREVKPEKVVEKKKRKARRKKRHLVPKKRIHVTAGLPMD